MADAVTDVFAADEQQLAGVIGQGQIIGVVGGDDAVAYVVFTGYVDAWFEFDMVDGEACDFFHGVPPGRENRI